MLTPKQQQLFESKFEPEPMTGCWLWAAGVAGNGYPQFAINRVLHGAHRVAYMLYKGAIPKDMLVCHTCDNPLCVNPAHLFVGTDKDNQQDCVKKGRHAYQTETHPLMKIRSREKEDICLLGWMNWPQMRIAEALGVKGRNVIRNVLLKHGIPLQPTGRHFS